MSKRVLRAAAALCLVALIFLLAGCERTTAAEEDVRTTSVFVTVENNMLFNIVYDKETRVMYSVSNFGNGSGVLTLLVNADGTPKLWEADREVSGDA
jgi:hypothetical protein